MKIQSKLNTKLLVNVFPWVSLILVVAVFGVASKGLLFSAYNLKTIFSQSVLFIIGGLGLSFLFAQGAFDLSFGSVVCLSLIHICIKEFSVPYNGLDVKICVASGLANARKVLESVKSGEKEYHFIEVMACPGGCVMGGGQPVYGLSLIHISSIRRRRTASVTPPVAPKITPPPEPMPKGISQDSEGSASKLMPWASIIRISSVVVST